jgi:hypothetical protein
MSEIGPNVAVLSTWPPREGRRFFVLWICATMAGWMALRAIGFVETRSGNASAWLDHYWLNAFPSVAVGMFEGWLLFKWGPRLIAWGILPATHVAIPYIARGGYSTAWTTLFGLATILTTVIATCLLVGVRRKPWLWLFINLGALVVNQMFIGIAFSWLGITRLDEVASKIDGLLGLPSALAFSGTALFTAASSGIWLASAVLEAFALAWWMRPLDAGSQLVAPVASPVGGE